MYLKNSKRLCCIVWIYLVISGCSSIMTGPLTLPPSQGKPSQEGDPIQSQEKSTPRALASLQLTEQGKLQLEQGRVDGAIRVLEQATNLHPANGLNYYYLAEAWYMKGNMMQAKEFNRLAGMYLNGETGWALRITKQHERIMKVSGQ